MSPKFHQHWIQQKDLFEWRLQDSPPNPFLNGNPINMILVCTHFIVFFIKSKGIWIYSRGDWLELCNYTYISSTSGTVLIHTKIIMKQLQTSDTEGQEMTEVTRYFIPGSTHFKKLTHTTANSAKGQVQLSTWPVPLKEMVCSTR